MSLLVLMNLIAKSLLNLLIDVKIRFDVMGAPPF